MLSQRPNLARASHVVLQTSFDAENSAPRRSASDQTSWTSAARAGNSERDFSAVHVNHLDWHNEAHESKRAQVTGEFADEVHQLCTCAHFHADSYSLWSGARLVVHKRCRQSNGRTGFGPCIITSSVHHPAIAFAVVGCGLSQLRLFQYHSARRHLLQPKRQIDQPLLIEEPF